MPKATIGDAEFYFEQHGESGPKVLFIMGLGARSVGWMPLVREMENDHRMCIHDHRGVGESAARSGPASMGQFANDALGLANHLGWDSFHLVGISMGGMIAQHLALAHRARIESMTLMVTTARGLSTTRPPPALAMLLARTAVGPRRKRVEATQELLRGKHKLEGEAKEASLKVLSEVFGHCSLATLLSHRAAINRHDTRKKLAQLEGLPTLLVGGTHDRLVHPKETRKLQKLMPWAETLWVEEAGHRVQSDGPKEVAAALRGLTGVS